MRMRFKRNHLNLYIYNILFKIFNYLKSSTIYNLRGNSNHKPLLIYHNDILNFVKQKDYSQGIVNPSSPQHML